MKKPFVIKHIGSQDSKEWAVVEHASNPVGQMNMLKVWGWFAREDDARALAHAMEYPE